MGDNGSGSRAATSTIFSGVGCFVFWLFTIGYAHLSFGQAVLAIAIWPWYLGVALGP